MIFEYSNNARMQRAKEIGYNIKAYHGTYSDFGEFNIGDLGFHFGTLDQAHARIDRSYAKQDDDDGGDEGMNIKPVMLKIQNPLHMEDVFGWDEPSDVIDGLLNTREFMQHAPQKVQDELNGLLKFAESEKYDESHETKVLNHVRKIIKSVGFDSIVYSNGVEGTGDSYLVFDASQIRSIFAKFDQSKQGSGNISDSYMRP